MISEKNSFVSFSYYHRGYRNDTIQSDSSRDWLCQAERAAFAALPFVTLNKSMSFPVSLGLGTLRTWTTATQFVESYSRGGGTKEAGYHFLQTAIAVASLAGTIFAHPLGMLMTTLHDLTIESCHLIDHLQAGKREKALESCITLLNHGLYLATMCSGAPEFLIVSLAFQVLSSVYQSQSEFREGRWIEASSHMLMAFARGKQLDDAIKALDLKWKILALQKKSEEPECKLLSAKLQQGGMPDGYSKESIRLELESLGFDVFKVANNGNNVLHQAVIKGNLRAVELSLAYGFDISRQNNAGDTPLHYAAARGNLDIVQYLVEKKADWRIKNNLDQLPFHKGLKQQSIVDYFVSLGYVREHFMHEYATAQGLRPDYTDSKGHNFYHRLLLSENLPLFEAAIKSKFRLDLLRKMRGTIRGDYSPFDLFLHRCRSDLPALQTVLDELGKGWITQIDLIKATEWKWLEGLKTMIPYCHPKSDGREWKDLSIEEIEDIRSHLLCFAGWFPGYDPSKGNAPGIIAQFLLDYDFKSPLGARG